MIQGISKSCPFQCVGRIPEGFVFVEGVMPKGDLELIRQYIGNNLRRVDLSTIYDSALPDDWEYDIHLPDGRRLIIGKTHYPFGDLYIADLFRPLVFPA